MKTPPFLYRLIFDNSINLLKRGEVSIIDIGSSGGIVPKWDNKPYLIKNLVRLEPRDSIKIQKNIIDLDCCVWDRNTTKNLYIYKGRGGTGSSLFRQNYEYVRKYFHKLQGIGDSDLAKTWFDRSELIKTQNVKCRTLDSLLNEYSLWGKYHLLKIDAQGAEYQILNGAKKFLKDDCCAVFLETFTIPMYLGIHLYPDIKKLLLGIGFVLAKKFPPHGTFNSQNDCLFIKKGRNTKALSIIKNLYGI